MTLYENGKRVCGRGVVFYNNKVVLMERNHLVDSKMIHYYTIPGGGVSENETYEEAAVREMEEECTLKTRSIKYLGREEFETGIVYWYHLEYLEGIPKLGGEELERNCENNHYKVIEVTIEEAKNLNILGEGLKMIEKAYANYEEINEKL